MITPIGISAQSTGKVTTEANGKMGKMDFLKMLVAQMKSQDPLSPIDNTQFAAQLAQFSQLEQMTNMSKAFTDLQQVAMLGKWVTANGIGGTLINGKATSVNVNDETPVMTLAKGAVLMYPDGTKETLLDESTIALKDVREASYEPAVW
ncbi:MAG: flagellar hook capping FlgD N-terminal domain-containing protein [bacterium]